MDFLKKLGIKSINNGVCSGNRWKTTDESALLKSKSPIDGKTVARVRPATPEALEKIITRAGKAFTKWRDTPAPMRGEIVRQIGLELRLHKEALGRLVSYEMGKSLEEGLGEVQEMIDICDFAVGQSRMLYGFTMHSERPSHRMYDQYHPLGIVGVLTAFNFPVAVWSWNAMIAAVCGNVVLWKPSSQVPLTAIAVMKIIGPVLKRNNVPEGVFSLVTGSGASIGERMLSDPRIPLISFTGSTRTGRHAAGVVAGRFGKSILELGGNNAIIITPEADLSLAVPAVVFGAVGTARQRCTTTHRVIIHASVYAKVKKALVKAYRSLKIGNPLDPTNHMGPLVDRKAVTAFIRAMETIEDQGGNVLSGGHALNGKGFESGCYVAPTLVEAKADMAILGEETFAPILYLVKYKGEIGNGIALQNNVAQGLSSAIFSNNLREAETFLSHAGSDCGIANVNIGTSGAEIGGAFGGEKETGGGRESGSDAWKAYMRRQTVTINYGTKMPLAQGITFNL